MSEPDYVMVEMDILGVMRPVQMELATAERYLKERKEYELELGRLRLEAEAAVHRCRLLDPNNDITLIADTLALVRRYVFAVGSARRTEVLLDLLEQAPTAMFWPILREAWSVCDGTWLYRVRLLRLLREHARRQNPHGFMSEDEQQEFEGHPDPVTVYRGCSRPRVKGPSWTTDRNVAASFARGHRGIEVSQPVIASGQVSKSQIFAFFIGRNESELLIDPRHIIGLRIRTY